MGDVLYLPGVTPERADTPVADQLEEALSEVVRRLEATRPSGRHPTAVKLARVILLVRQAEVTVSGQATAGESAQRIARAKEIVAFAKQQLLRVDVARLVGELGDASLGRASAHLGRSRKGR